MLGDRVSLLDAQMKLMKTGMRVNAMCVLRTIRGAFYSRWSCDCDCEVIVLLL